MPHGGAALGMGAFGPRYCPGIDRVVEHFPHHPLRS